jgi:RimJ/RimL family protein N-acetyltransferase
MELINVTAEDYDMLYTLLDERPMNANISHSKTPSWDEHVVFCESQPYWKWYIIKAGETRVGACYITHNNEIGIAILDEYKRHGLAVKALKRLMGTHTPLPEVKSVRPANFIANINPNNEASKKLFKGLGFTKIQETYERGE